MTTRIIALVFVSGFALGACSDGGSGAGADAGADPVDPPALALHGETAPLPGLGVEAVAIAPAWLRHDLGLALRKQEAARADELAALITEAEDPRTIDEIAFSIAHTSPEIIASDSFYPELFALNAQLIYEHDALLDYVELVDTGVPGVDDDFWTTATYVYQTKGGGLEQRTVSRDIYYWFVVHPKLEDESPWFIDSWQACNSTSTLECAATPDEGWFWREFLWEVAGETCPEAGLCPTLGEWLPGVEFVWDEKKNGAAGGAIREIVDFMRYQPVEGDSWLDFGAYGERSIQPNRIYGLGRGNCGEWADMTTALARTALVPNANASPSSWDHTWNAFFDQGWIEWEPVNFAIDTDYSGWGASFAGAGSFYIARGDGLVLLQTADYRDDIFTMEIEVYDSEGAPVPGASVSVWAPIPDTDYWSYAGEAPADADGVATFPLGALKAYAVRIETPIGTWPVEENKITYASEGIAVGETDVQSYNLAVALPAPLPATVVAVEGEIAATVRLAFADLGARFTTYGQRFGTTYTVEAPAPELQALLVDEANLALLDAGSPFEAAWEGTASDADLEIPLDRDWYLVLANAQISVAAFGTLSVDAEPLVDGDWTGSASPLETPYEILPGGKLVVSITPAE